MCFPCFQCFPAPFWLLARASVWRCGRMVSSSRRSQLHTCRPLLKSGLSLLSARLFHISTVVHPISHPNKSSLVEFLIWEFVFLGSRSPLLTTSWNLSTTCDKITCQQSSTASGTVVLPVTRIFTSQRADDNFIDCNLVELTDILAEALRATGTWMPETVSCLLNQTIPVTLGKQRNHATFHHCLHLLL